MIYDLFIRLLHEWYFLVFMSQNYIQTLLDFMRICLYLAIIMKLQIFIEKKYRIILKVFKGINYIMELLKFIKNCYVETFYLFAKNELCKMCKLKAWNIDFDNLFIKHFYHSSCFTWLSGFLCLAKTKIITIINNNNNCR